MSHDLDDDLIVPPDRRPLVYGGAAIVILLVAAFLFWPRGSEVASPDVATSDLMPGQPTTQASDESVTTDSPMLEADASGSSSVATMVDDATSAPTGTASNPVAETKIVEENPNVAPTERSTPPAIERPNPQRVREEPNSQPAASGEWVLNVGSFSSRANADRRVEELARKGVDAHVQVASTGDGSTVYRVRVGYFGSSSDAKTHGAWLKSSQDLDSWASRR